MGVVVWARMVSTRVTRGIVVAVSVAIAAMCVAMSWAVLASMGTVFIGTIGVVVGTMLAVCSLVKSVMVLGFLKNGINVCFENDMFRVVSSLTSHLSGIWYEEEKWENWFYLIITLAIVFLAVLSIVAVLVSSMAVVGPMMAAVVSAWMRWTMFRSPVARRRWRVVGWIYSQIRMIDTFHILHRAFVV